MQIAVISSGHIPSPWAHSINTVKMADAFTKIGHLTRILTVERFAEKNFKKKITDVNSFYGIDKRIKIDFFQDHSVFYYAELRYLRSFLLLLCHLTNNKIRSFDDPERQISDSCAKFKIDLAFCRTYRAAYYNVTKSIPTIVESHTPHTHHPDLAKTLSLGRHPAFKGLVTISPVLKNKFVEAGFPEEKILVLDGAVDLDSFEGISKESARAKVGLSMESTIVLYSGHLYQGRGIDTILEAALLVPDKLFILVGGFPADVARWQRFAEDIGASNVRFTGFVHNSLIPFYLCAADMLLMPYTRDTSTHQWMSPVKLFEYMASGRPIIASDLDAIRAKLSHMNTAVLVPEKNAMELSRAVRLLTKDTVLARRLANNVKQEAGKYSFKRRAETIIKEVL